MVRHCTVVIIYVKEENSVVSFKMHFTKLYYELSLLICGRAEVCSTCKSVSFKMCWLFYHVNPEKTHFYCAVYIEFDLQLSLYIFFSQWIVFSDAVAVVVVVVLLVQILNEYFQFTALRCSYLMCWFSSWAFSARKDCCCCYFYINFVHIDTINWMVPHKIHRKIYLNWFGSHTILTADWLNDVFVLFCLCVCLVFTLLIIGG